MSKFMWTLVMIRNIIIVLVHVLLAGGVMGTILVSIYWCICDGGGFEFSWFVSALIYAAVVMILFQAEEVKTELGEELYDLVTLWFYRNS